MRIASKSETLVRGSRDLVGPSGASIQKGSPIDSEFSWSYRADSLDYVQFTDDPKNFAYAQVFPNGKIGTYFTPFGEGAMHGPASRTRRIQGQDPGPETSNAAMDRKTGAGVLVSNIWRAEGGCETNICVPGASSTGVERFDGRRRCFRPDRRATDNGFRVFWVKKRSIRRSSANSEIRATTRSLASTTTREQLRVGRLVGQGPIPRARIRCPAGITFINKGKDFPGPRKIEYFHPAPGNTASDSGISWSTDRRTGRCTRPREKPTGATIAISGDIDYHNVEIGVSCFDGNGAPRDAIGSWGCDAFTTSPATRSRSNDNIIQIDDAIPRAYQDQIQAELGSIADDLVFHEESARAAKAQFDTNFAGFSHPAFNIREPNPVLSPLNAVLVPVLYLFCEKAGLPFTTLLRVRIGLFTKGTAEAAHHNPHVDFYEPHHTALYYVNDSDGDSWVFNQTYQDVPAHLAAADVNEESSLSPAVSRPRRDAWRPSTGALSREHAPHLT